jgi:hypothetical protein
MYRDAGNFKAYGELLLEGSLSNVKVVKLRSHFESGEYFIAEQIGMPTLYEQLWKECECGPSVDMDHVYHEFIKVRSATEEDLVTLEPWGSAIALMATIEKIGVWDLTLSRNWNL